MPKPANKLVHYVGLLRGINVGGHKAVSMSAFRELMEASGFTDVKTLLQSGNVIFCGVKQSLDTLEHQIEAAALKQLGLEADVMIRTSADWEQIIKANPFVEAAESDPSHLVVICLKSKPAASALETCRAAIKGRERIELLGRELYAFYVDGIGTSKLTNTVIEKCLGTRGTGRNWNTVLKIQKLLSERSAS